MIDTDKQFLEWLEGHCRWYAKESSKWVTILGVCKTLALASTFASIVVAAVVDKENFALWGKWLLIASTLLSALASETLGQLRVREMEELREYGNLECARLRALATQKFDEFEEDRARISSLKDEIRERIADIELAQHNKYVSLNRGDQQSGRERQGTTARKADNSQVEQT